MKTKQLQEQLDYFNKIIWFSISIS